MSIFCSFVSAAKVWRQQHVKPSAELFSFAKRGYCGKVHEHNIAKAAEIRRIATTHADTHQFQSSGPRSWEPLLCHVLAWLKCVSVAILHDISEVHLPFSTKSTTAMLYASNGTLVLIVTFESDSVRARLRSWTPSIQVYPSFKSSNFRERTTC